MTALTEVTNHGEPTPRKARRSEADRLVALALQNRVELFQASDGRLFAAVPVETHRETILLGSRTFRSWLGRLAYTEWGKVPGLSAVQAAVATLAGMAEWDGDKQDVFVRIAEHEGSIYLDLGGPRREVVHVSPHETWAIITDPPVRFIRPPGMGELPRPVAGGSVEDLRPFMNLEDENAWKLLVGWLVFALCPRGPFPILDFSGEPGSGKTTQAKLVKRLIDPTTPELRSEMHEPRDLAIAAMNTRLLAFDNLSRLPRRTSDIFCRLSTGAGFTVRKLYEDTEETIFAGQPHPVILTGIPELATETDLADRTIPLPAPAIPDAGRRPDAELSTAFARAHPHILGALITAAEAALRSLPTVRLPRSPRMVEFVKWVTAAEGTLGWEPGTFLAVAEDARTLASATTLEGVALPDALRTFAKQWTEWAGPSSELLDHLRTIAGDRTRERGWPANASHLGRDLPRLAPALRAVGVNVKSGRACGGDRERYVRVWLTSGVNR